MGNQNKEGADSGLVLDALHKGDFGGPHLEELNKVWAAGGGYPT